MFGTAITSFDFIAQGFFAGVVMWLLSCGVEIVVKAIRGIGGTLD